MSLFGAMLLLPLYYQQVQGTDAIGAGLLLAPQGVGMLLGTQVAGRLIDRLGSERGIVLAGMTLALFGTLPYGFADAHTNQILLAAALVVRGAGLGLAVPATMTATHRTLPVDAIPAATTASRKLQQLGAVLGSTVLGVILDRAGVDTPTTQAAAFHTTFWWSIGFSVLGFLTAWALPSSDVLGTASRTTR
jgi:MFS family permease